MIKMAKKIAKGNLTISLSELSQEIDLKSYLGRKPTKSEKASFAALAQATIEERTLDGKTINGGKFKKYSKAYADFKGVTRDSVDLFLEGDMLESIGRRSSKEKAGTVFVQMEKGVQTKKGFNHTSGDTVPKRNFFGITDSEARDIANEIKDSTIEKKQSITALRAALDELDIEQTE
jgi:hypothetical protein